VRPTAPSKLNLEQAYEAAYLWLFHIDQAPTNVVEKPPEMVELYSEELVIWVRAGAEVTQRAIIAFLQLDDERKKVIISATGYSPGAISVSETQGLALFTMGADGSVHAETGHAVMMMPLETPPAPFAIPPEEEEVVTSASWGTTKFDSDVWVDCPECGTNQHVSLKSCRVCGTRLVVEPVIPVTGPKYECRVCGSHDIEVLTGLPPTPEPDEAAKTDPKDNDKFDSRR